MEETYMDRFIRRALIKSAVLTHVSDSIKNGEAPTGIMLKLLDSTKSTKRQHLIGLASTVGYLYEMRYYDGGKTPIIVPSLNCMNDVPPHKFYEDKYLGRNWNSKEAVAEFEVKYENALTRYSKEELRTIDLSYLVKQTGSAIVQQMIVSGFYVGRYRFLKDKELDGE